MLAKPCFSLYFIPLDPECGSGYMDPNECRSDRIRIHITGSNWISCLDISNIWNQSDGIPGYPEGYTALGNTDVKKQIFSYLNNFSFRPLIVQFSPVLLRVNYWIFLGEKLFYDIVLLFLLSIAKTEKKDHV